MVNTLFLQFEGVMQSWGERAQWSVRDTAPEPTKSGVIGLLACSLGFTDDQQISNLSLSLKMGVRYDLAGTYLIDYHTVVGGVISAEGKIKRTASTKEPETVVSIRQYLCDASFLIALQGAEDLIDNCAKAVQAPFWPYFLGRKSCVPTRPVYAGTGSYPSLEEALKSYPINETYVDQSFKVVIECEPGEGDRRKDQVGSRSNRIFLPRFTRTIWVTPPASPKGVV